MTPNPTDDLAWLAFRYVADALNDDERDAFEQALDADQSAREAVAEAVAVVGSVALGRRTGTFPVRLVTTVLAAAACLVLAVSPWLFSTGPGLGREPEGTTASVALHWSGLRQETADDRHELLAWLDDSATEDASEGEDSESADAPPAWLIDAASMRPGS